MASQATPRNDSDDEGSDEAYWRFRAFVTNVLAVPKEEIDEVREREEVEGRVRREQVAPSHNAKGDE